MGRTAGPPSEGMGAPGGRSARHLPSNFGARSKLTRFPSSQSLPRRNKIIFHFSYLTFYSLLSRLSRLGPRIFGMAKLRNGRPVRIRCVSVHFSKLISQILQPSRVQWRRKGPRMSQRRPCLMGWICADYCWNWSVFVLRNLCVYFLRFRTSCSFPLAD